MANYGIPYMGSKNGIANDLISMLPSGKRFVDLFGGGFAMSHCACISNKYEKVLYNEYNALLPAMLIKAIRGEYSYDVFKPEFVTREEFYERKELDGYIKYIWSFSNSGDDYLFGKDIEKQKQSIHNWVVFNIKDQFIENYFPDIDRYIKTQDIKKRRLLFRTYVNKTRPRIDTRMQQLERLERLQQLEQLERLQQLEQLERLDTLKNLQQLERLALVHGDYKDYKYCDGDIVYCDPPYEDTAKYNNKSQFNHKEFYDWVASRDYQVWFSSYNNISDDRFKKVWASGKRSLMAGASNLYNYEVLYSNR